MAQEEEEEGRKRDLQRNESSLRPRLEEPEAAGSQSYRSFWDGGFQVILFYFRTLFQRRVSNSACSGLVFQSLDFSSRSGGGETFPAGAAEGREEDQGHGALSTHRYKRVDLVGPILGHGHCFEERRLDTFCGCSDPAVRAERIEGCGQP